VMEGVLQSKESGREKQVSQNSVATDGESSGKHIDA